MTCKIVFWDRYKIKMRQHRVKYCYNFDDVYDARKQWYKNMTGKEWQDDSDKYYNQ